MHKSGTGPFSFTGTIIVGAQDQLRTGYRDMVCRDTPGMLTVLLEYHNSEHLIAVLTSKQTAYIKT